MTWNTVQPPPLEHGKAIIFDVLTRSAIRFSFAFGLVFFGLAIPWEPAEFFFVASGSVLSIILFLALLSEWSKQDRLFDSRIPPVDKAPAGPAVLEVHNHYHTAGGDHIEIARYPQAKIPPADFLEYLFKSAGADGRIPAERSIRDDPRWMNTAFNDWLDSAEKEGCLTRVDTRPNSARKIAGTLENALSKFGHASPPLPGGTS